MPGTSARLPHRSNDLHRTSRNASLKHYVCLFVCLLTHFGLKPSWLKHGSVPSVLAIGGSGPHRGGKQPDTNRIANGLYQHRISKIAMRPQFFSWGSGRSSSSQLWRPQHFTMASDADSEEAAKAPTKGCGHRRHHLRAAVSCKQGSDVPSLCKDVPAVPSSLPFKAIDGFQFPTGAINACLAAVHIKLASRQLHTNHPGARRNGAAADRHQFCIPICPLQAMCASFDDKPLTNRYMHYQAELYRYELPRRGHYCLFRCRPHEVCYKHYVAGLCCNGRPRRRTPGT